MKKKALNCEEYPLRLRNGSDDDDECCSTSSRDEEEDHDEA